MDIIGLHYVAMMDICNELYLDDQANLALAYGLTPIHDMVLENYNALRKKCKPLTYYIEEGFDEDDLIHIVNMNGSACDAYSYASYRACIDNEFSKLLDILLDNYDHDMFCNQAEHKSSLANVACRHKGSTKLPEMIIKKARARPDYVDNEKNSILTWACCCGTHELIDLLITNYDLQQVAGIPNVHNRTPLMYLLNRCSHSKTNELIIKFLDIFHLDSNPQFTTPYFGSALMTSCYHKDGLITRELIKRFGSLCMPEYVIVSNGGRTALIECCIYKNSSTAKLLIETFGNQCLPHHIADNHGNPMSALDYAIHNGMTEIVNMLS